MCLNLRVKSRSFEIVNVFLILLFRQIGDLGLAVSSDESRRVTTHVAGTRSHILPEASKSTAIEPDEAWDIYTCV